MIPLNSQFLDSSAQQKKGSGVSILTAEYVIKELQDVVVATVAMDNILVDRVVQSANPVRDEADRVMSSSVDSVMVDTMGQHDARQMEKAYLASSAIEAVVVDVGLIIHRANPSDDAGTISSTLDAISLDTVAFLQNIAESHSLSTTIDAILVDKGK